MCSHSSRINSRRQQHQDYYSCINKMSPRIQIIGLKKKKDKFLTTKPDKQWTQTDQRKRVIERVFFFFHFDLISSRQSTVSHRQMNAVICGQDNPIRTGFSDRKTQLKV